MDFSGLFPLKKSGTCDNPRWFLKTNTAAVYYKKR